MSMIKNFVLLLSNFCNLYVVIRVFIKYCLHVSIICHLFVATHPYDAGCCLYLAPQHL
jgi:hypothetical protein